MIADNTVVIGARDIAPVSGTPGWGTDGVPGSVPATQDAAWHDNMITAELVAIVQAAGMALDRTDWAQVLKALTRLTAPAGQCRLAIGSNTTAVLSPFNGAGITIQGARYLIPSAGVTLNVGSCLKDAVAAQALSASTTYYIGARISGGNIVLSAWTKPTYAHSADATAGNVGVEIITGQPTDSLVGMLRTNGSGQLATAQPLVLCWHNRRQMVFSNSYTSQGTSSTSFVELNSAARVDVLAWSDTPLIARHDAGAITDTGGNGAAIAMGLDNASVWAGSTGTTASLTGANQSVPTVSQAKALVAEGYHFIEALGKVTAGGVLFTGGIAVDTLG